VGIVKGMTAYLGVDFGWEKPEQEQIDFREIGRGSTLDVGCYLTQLACLVFDNEKPERIHAYGSLHPSGKLSAFSLQCCR
jgi:predicted dehydrogenase